MSAAPCRTAVSVPLSTVNTTVELQNRAFVLLCQFLPKTAPYQEKISCIVEYNSDDKTTILDFLHAHIVLVVYCFNVLTVYTLKPRPILILFCIFHLAFYLLFV